MIVHCLGGLGAAVSVQAAELSRGDRVFTEWTLEGTEAVHHRHRVMSHDFKYSAFNPAWLRTKVTLIDAPTFRLRLGITRRTAVNINSGCVVSVGARFTAARIPLTSLSTVGAPKSDQCSDVVLGKTPNFDPY
jgi:hypothetical protein